ncbi:non-ribosomal peptide synthetase, partial [Sphingomonas gei]
MVPAAYVLLDALPLTPNGKLDRGVLPAPDGDAFARQAYEAPQGEIEQALAAIWSELLGVERISRHDNFFELGGYSLLVIQLLARLRRLNLSTDVRTLFVTPVLAELAATLGSFSEVAVPPNLITPDSLRITPEMLPLIDLTQEDIDRIVERTPGGIANIQDIYALSPLQEGILFHHLLARDGDPYLQAGIQSFPDRALLDCYLEALQQVVDRHDILRTGFVWEGLPAAAQIVWRKAQLSVTEVVLDPDQGPAVEQLARRFDPRHHRIDLSEPPLLRFAIAFDGEQQRWLLLQLQHHLIGDHSTLEVLTAEVALLLEGRGDSLAPAHPYRQLVAQARLGIPAEEHERFFREMLGDVDEPTFPFGLADVQGDGRGVVEARRMLPASLNQALRAHARRLGVSLASLCHLAWAQVLARTSGREAVVFGTVLFGRMHADEARDGGMGLFINTLPLRLDIDHSGVEASVLRAHARLADLLRHEHASLAMAQRCSGVPAQTPLFSALLNYRHNSPPAAPQDDTRAAQIAWISGEERTNYPFGLSVEDFGNALGVTAQVVETIPADRVCAYMQQALESLADALANAPDSPVCALEILPAEERTLLLDTWNATEAPYPEHLCVHQLFEAQAARDPEAVAL